MNARRNSLSVPRKITLKVVLAALCLFVSTIVQAEEKLAPVCLQFELFGLPPALKQAEKFRLSGKLFDVAKLKAKTTVLDVSVSSNAKLPQLGERTYLYVIDKSQRLAITERFLDPGADVPLTARTKFLGSHEGLKRMLQNGSSENVELVAAGEIVIRNGRVFAVGNGAGTYPGGTENLNYALAKLKKAGLKIDDRTDVRDYSKNAYRDPHDFEGMQTLRAIRELRDPKFSAFFDQCRRVMTVVDGKFPNAENFYIMAKASTGDERLQTAYYRAARLLIPWSDAANNEVWAAHRFYEDFGDEAGRAALQALEDYASRLSPAHQ